MLHQQHEETFRQRRICHLKIQAVCEGTNHGSIIKCVLVYMCVCICVSVNMYTLHSTYAFLFLYLESKVNDEPLLSGVICSINVCFVILMPSVSVLFQFL